MTNDVVIVPAKLEEMYCEFCMSYKYQEAKNFVYGWQKEEGKTILHFDAGHLCLDCATFNPIGAHHAF